MKEKLERREPPPYDPERWGYDEAWYAAVTEGLRMTPAERLRWLEEAMAEMRELLGSAAEARREDGGRAGPGRPEGSMRER